jgi:alpha-glucosidase
LPHSAKNGDCLLCPKARSQFAKALQRFYAAWAERAVTIFRPVRITLVVFALFASIANAQDERRVKSPNGQLEFRLFIATQPTSNLSRLAYEVFLKGKPLLNESFLGLDIQDQEPLLGENVGLTSSTSSTSPTYNSLTAKYMQNGSLGRLINIEVRVYDDGVALRYVIPPSTPLMDLPISEEATEFHFVENLDVGSWVDGGPEDPYNMEFSRGSPRPFVMLRLSSTWVAISESKAENYPGMHLIRVNPTTDLTRLDHKFQGATPLVCPWRIISIGSSNRTVLQTGIISDLNR